MKNMEHVEEGMKSINGVYLYYKKVGVDPHWSLFKAAPVLHPTLEPEDSINRVQH